ncbi:tetratricopeptide repeat protein [Salinisphaera sp. SPP-AMP-43]|uniref:tetratricopeptide repeat protein n=1 Tax=Salinisphaera sp. SPP-AMP-43 TaxID=3121288 RepID=UPI003C6E36BA
MSKRQKASQQGAPFKSGKQSAANTYAQKARKHYSQGEFDRAIKLLKQAIALAPTSALHRELGQWFLKIKRQKEGIQHLETAIKFDTNSVIALTELGQEYTKQNNPERAHSLIEKALSLSEEHPAAHFAYGNLLQKQGDLPNAVKHLRAALKFKLANPVNPGEPPAPTHGFNKAETEELMWSTLSVLARSGIHAFASYGTLLGIIREGGLLPFDKDIDFGLPHSEMDRAAECLKNNGWVEAGNSFLINPRAFVHLLTGVTLDLSGFVVDSKTGETFTGFWMTSIPYEWARNTRYDEIRLRKRLSPANDPLWELENPEAWLESIYGDWRTPDPDFDTVIAAKNLYSFSLLTQTYAFARIYSKWQNGQIRKALALARHTQRHLSGDRLLSDIEAYLSSVAPKAPALRDNEDVSLQSYDSEPISLKLIDTDFAAESENDTETLRFDS